MTGSLWPWALLSGALLVLSFPPFGLWPLAFAALAPLFWARGRCPGERAAANLGGAAGLAFYPVSLFWYAKVYGWAAAGFWCVFALWMALHGALAWSLDRRWRAGSAARDLGFVLASAVIWTGIEYFRSEIWPLRCPSLALGFSQTPDLPLLQAASLFGVYGLGGLIVASNEALALAARGRWKPAAACAAAILSLGLWGRHRMGDPALLSGTRIRAAVIQDESHNLSRLAAMSLAGPARGARLLVWPEYSFAVPPSREKPFLRTLARDLAGSKAVAVLAGVSVPDDPRSGRVQNFAWVMAPGGRLLGRYDKSHPVPYVEKGLAPNPSPRPVPAPWGPLGVQICYDLDFEGGARTMADQGARALAVPDMDPLSWPAWEREQRSAMAPARAAESGLWIARAASSGISQLIDPAGRVTASLPDKASGALVGTIALRRGGTPYTRRGWLWGPCCLAATAAWILWVVKSKKFYIRILENR